MCICGREAREMMKVRLRGNIWTCVYWGEEGVGFPVQYILLGCLLRGWNFYRLSYFVLGMESNDDRLG